MTDWTRRALLGAGVAALAGAGLLVWTGRRAAETARADALVAVLRDRNAASRVGERILTELPAWGDATALRASLDRIAKTAREIIDDAENTADRKAVA